MHASPETQRSAGSTPLDSVTPLGVRRVRSHNEAPDATLGLEEDDYGAESASFVVSTTAASGAGGAMSVNTIELVRRSPKPSADLVLPTPPTPYAMAVAVEGTPAHAAEPDDSFKKPLEGRRSISLSAEMGAELGQQLELIEPRHVGSYSCRGVDAERLKEGLSREKVNQDCACMAHPFAKRTDCALFCVLDGHGAHGERVSNEVRASRRT